MPCTPWQSRLCLHVHQPYTHPPSTAPVCVCLSDPARSTSVRREEMISVGEATGLESMYRVNMAWEREDAAFKRWEAMTWQAGRRGGWGHSAACQRHGTNRAS